MGWLHPYPYLVSAIPTRETRAAHPAQQQASPSRLFSICSRHFFFLHVFLSCFYFSVGFVHFFYNFFIISRNVHVFKNIHDFCKKVQAFWKIVHEFEFWLMIFEKWYMFFQKLFKIF
jgi:hypothetical protein